MMANFTDSEIKRDAKALLESIKKEVMQSGTNALLIKSDRALRPKLSVDHALEYEQDRIPSQLIPQHIPGNLNRIIHALDSELNQYLNILVPTVLKVLDEHNTNSRQFIFKSVCRLMERSDMLKWGIASVLEEAILTSYWSFRTDLISTKQIEHGVLEDISQCLLKLVTVDTTRPSSKKTIELGIPIRDPVDAKLKRVEIIYTSFLSGALDAPSELHNDYCRVLSQWMKVMGPLVVKHFKLLFSVIETYVAAGVATDSVNAVLAVARQYDRSSFHLSKE